MAVTLDDEKTKNVIRQVEFYFSDSNLPRDKFLRTTVEESEDGLVSLALICSFSRMRKHLDLGELKPEEIAEETVLAVAEVLRKSSSLRVSEDGKKIGRSTELLKPEDVIEQVDSRTVAASPLPYDVKIEDVQAFFDEKGKVNSVRLPKHIGDKRAFCGTALIEFSDEDVAKNVLQEKIIYAGVDLELTTKNDFDVEREKKVEGVGRNRSSKDSSNKDSSNESYPKGLIVAFELKPVAVLSTKQNDSETLKEVEVIDTVASKSSKSEEATENIDHEEKSSENIVEEGGGNSQADDLQNEEKAAGDSSQKNEMESDKVLPTDDENKPAGSADDSVVVTREDLKEVFQKFGIVKYIDFRMGEQSGFIRFDEPDAAIKARAFSVLSEEGGLVVKKKYIATLEALTGEAERDYWSLLRGNKDKFRENRNYRGRGKHHRGGRHFDGKRSRDTDYSVRGRPNKTQKVSD
ncbi:la protein 1 [Dendrobium catenatum]|uniref:La protein 1 n=1 Tax=Dendrobium catenatum TaxID=906689 RepID=A0A2I0X0P8_9ASPA|nr:la protein 1 [Dendrobium catenatum]PKU81457.1 hypothetical protein MA16_Dca015862 [Dendrobium catenatum]